LLYRAGGDREQMIESLKAAFVEERLTKEEAVAVPTVLAFATSIPPAFLFIVSFFFTALLAGGGSMNSTADEVVRASRQRRGKRNR
jgi:hypothetical protein